MAQDIADDQAVELVDTVEDNAKQLTSGIVFATTAVMVVALVVMLNAIGHWFEIGPFKG
ncbi:MAG TPA: hypothetical protein VEI02_12100 [Planctomycetota bacterium]|nr:hypothetical protein [Planctomycetota bacterium]